MRAWFGKLLAVVCTVSLMAGGTAQAQAKKAARLFVEDGAGLFSESTIKKAKDTIADVLGDREREVHIQTYAKLSDDDHKEFEALKKDVDAKKAEVSELEKFWDRWAKKKAVGDKDVVVLINKSPGMVYVLSDSRATKEGFDKSNDRKLKDMLTAGLREAASKTTPADQEVARNVALIDGVKYLANNLPTKSVPASRNSGNTTNHNNAPARNGAAREGVE